MKKEFNLELKVTDEENKLYGKINAFSLESLQEQMHKIEKLVDNLYICDICGEEKNIGEVTELSENQHVCENCNGAEKYPTQEELN